MTRLHMDYETYGVADLRKTGGYKYAKDPRTEVLMLGWAFDDDEPQIYLPHVDGPELPKEVGKALKTPGVNLHAFNAQFERLITQHVRGIETPHNRWRCAMVEAFYLSFAGGLDAALKAVGLDTKDKKGKSLINLFCSPAPKNHKAYRYDWDNRPKQWEEFVQYCLQDVKVERALWHWMQKFPTMERWDYEQYFLDQKINDRGVLLDVDMAQAACEIWDEEKPDLESKLAALIGTDLDKVTRNTLIKYFEEIGHPLDNTRKDYLRDFAENDKLPENAKQALALFTEKESKALTKYFAVMNVADAEDNRARGMFQYKGAARTDRVGGRLIQLQNLKRPFIDDPNELNTLCSLIKSKNRDVLKGLYGKSISDILSGSIRHTLIPRKDHTFAIADLSSIESVVLGWISQCPAIDSTFRSGRDSYKEFASRFYGIPYEDVTKEQRNFSKPPVLGCGYMLGWKGLMAYAEGYGVVMTENQARKAVSTFREMYPEIVQFWGWIDDACKYSAQTGAPVSGYRMHISRDSEFMRIKLPSGRNLSYHRPEVQTNIAPWPSKRMTCSSTYDELQKTGMTDRQMIRQGLMKAAYVDNITFMGNDQGYKWDRLSAHAGLLTENVVQSIAGDVLWSGLVNAENAGLRPVFHVHDEIGCEQPRDTAAKDLETLIECMTRKQAWNEDMWLGADGFLTDRYTKD